MLIQEIISTNTAKKIVTGDFSLLPTPTAKNFHSFFPCVLIETNNMDIFYDNKSLDTTTQSYLYNINYIYPYSSNLSDKDIYAMSQTKTIANILMNNRTLENLKCDKSINESGFVVVDSEIKSISFDNEIKQLFLNMEVPLSVSLIDYIVSIKTLRKDEF